MISNSRTAVTSVRVITTDEELQRLKDQWKRLFQESNASFFLSWEWLSSWWAAYRNSSSRLHVMLAFRGTELIGIAPFYIIESRNYLIAARKLMFLGTAPGAVISENMDLICREKDSEDACAAVAAAIIGNSACDELCLEKISSTSRILPLIKERAVKKKYYIQPQKIYSAPYLKLPDKASLLQGSLSASMRRSIRTNLKRLEKYKAEFRKTASPDEFERDFSELLRLHMKRWGARSLPGAFAQKNFLKFQRSVMREMLENGNLDLYFLSVSGTNIAALYNIRHRDKTYFYQGGLDIFFDEGLAPGLLLHYHCIERSIESGVKEYDFMMMGALDTYKKRWTTESRDQTDLYMVRPGSLKFLVSAGDKAKAIRRAVKGFLNNGSKYIQPGRSAQDEDNLNSK